jgi:acetyl-CoA C-acetyltransferase
MRRGAAGDPGRGPEAADIDGVFAHWDDRAAGLLVTEYMELTPRHVDSTVVGGQSNLTHIAHACAAMEAGLCDAALITYGSTQRLDRSRARGGLTQDPRLPTGQFVQPYGMLSPIGFYAMQARLHMDRYGTRPEDLGEVALAARRWAQLNPNAIAREPLTMADYLASPLVADPLRKLDICQVTDSGGASGAGARRARARPAPPPCWCRALPSATSSTPRRSAPTTGSTTACSPRWAGWRWSAPT